MTPDLKPLAACHVLVTSTSFGRYDAALRGELEAAVGRVTYNMHGRPLTVPELRDLLQGVDGVIAGIDEFTAAAIAGANQLKVIARYGVGISNVDLAAAQAAGVFVTNTPGANASAVAELAVALILNLLRSLPSAIAETKAGAWSRTRGEALSAKVVGIIGLGAVGKALVRCLSGFGCTILAQDVTQDAAFAAATGVQYVSRAQLLQQADIVSLHVPALPGTRGMVDAAFLSQMKPGSYLINMARGELVDEEALYAALAGGHLRGAALDCFRREPPGADNPLLSLPQVLPTPHIGAQTAEAANRMGRMALDDCLAVLRGQSPAHPVT